MLVVLGYTLYTISLSLSIFVGFDYIFIEGAIATAENESKLIAVNASNE